MELTTVCVFGANNFKPCEKKMTRTVRNEGISEGTELFPKES